ncbi:MAG TPA: hypothetical protein VM597_06030 [Gemmataceae bacterium]|jgi:hypothetical protein|nr:hypothetical protein [Gemmataceae bacterium]
MGAHAAKVLVRHEDCPACGRRHRFRLPIDDPVAQEYGYVCPATGRPAAIPPWGSWVVLRFPPTGVVTLVPIGSASICTPLPGLVLPTPGGTGPVSTPTPSPSEAPPPVPDVARATSGTPGGPHL